MAWSFWSLALPAKRRPVCSSYKRSGEHIVAISLGGDTAYDKIDLSFKLVKRRLHHRRKLLLVHLCTNTAPQMAVLVNRYYMPT